MGSHRLRYLVFELMAAGRPHPQDRPIAPLLAIPRLTLPGAVVEPLRPGKPERLVQAGNDAQFGLGATLYRAAGYDIASNACGRTYPGMAVLCPTPTPKVGTSCRRIKADAVSRGQTPRPVASAATLPRRRSSPGSRADRRERTSCGYDTDVAVTMNIGPLVLTNIGPPPGV